MHCSESLTLLPDYNFDFVLFMVWSNTVNSFVWKPLFCLPNGILTTNDL